MTEPYIDKIISILRETANSLNQNPEDNAVKLRNCPNKIDTVLSNSSINDNKRKHFIYLSFILNSFIEDVWANISGESTYNSKIRDGDVQKILTQIGTNLKKLCDCLDPVNPQCCYDLYVSLLDQYNTTINEIKNRFKRSEKLYESIYRSK